LFFRLFVTRAATRPDPDDLHTPTGRLRRWAADIAILYGQFHAALQTVREVLPPEQWPAYVERYRAKL